MKITDSFMRALTIPGFSQMWYSYWLSGSGYLKFKYEDLIITRDYLEQGDNSLVLLAPRHDGRYVYSYSDYRAACN